MMGDWDQAAKYYRQSLDTSTRLSAEFPTQTKYRVSLAVGLLNWAGISIEHGEFAQARKALEESLGHSRALLNLYPNSSRYAAMVVVNEYSLAEVAEAQGAGVEAATLRHDAEQLFAKTWQRLQIAEGPVIAARFCADMGGGLSGEGWRKCGRQDDMANATALKAFAQAIALDPNNAETHFCRGELCAQMGQHEEAAADFNQVLQLRRDKLGPDHPDTLQSMRDVAFYYGTHGRHGDALPLNERTLTLRKAKLGSDHPDTLQSMQDVAFNYSGLGRYADAIALNEKCLSLRQTKLGPDHPDTLSTMNSLAFDYTQLGQYADAFRLNEKLLALRKAKLGPRHPDTLALMNNLAWSLATCADPNLRDASRALELAKLTVELAPKDGNTWNTLGIAHYRAGDWKATISALEKSMELRKGGDSFDWFFLAMARWQVGDKKESRKWYDQAVQWQEKNQPKNEELGRFRSEAESLLKIERKATPK
jgi:tetratricopeptide (TPR) repeat protein